MRRWITRSLFIALVFTLVFCVINGAIHQKTFEYNSHMAGARSALRVAIIKEHRSTGIWPDKVSVAELETDQFSDLDVIANLSRSTSDEAMYVVTYRGEPRGQIIVKAK